MRPRFRMTVWTTSPVDQTYLEGRGTCQPPLTNWQLRVCSTVICFVFIYEPLNSSQNVSVTPKLCSIPENNLRLPPSICNIQKSSQSVSLCVFIFVSVRRIFVWTYLYLKYYLRQLSFEFNDRSLKTLRLYFWSFCPDPASYFVQRQAELFNLWSFFWPNKTLSVGRLVRHSVTF